MKFLLRVPILYLILILLLTWGGSVMADNLPGQTPETQGITTTTVVECVGTVTNNVDLVWTTSSGPIDNIPAIGGSQVTVGYTESTVAVDGFIRYVKDFSVDTADKTVIGSNLKTNRQIQYISAGNGGRMTSTETFLLDSMGTYTPGEDAMLCPFGATDGGGVPAFCNIVTAGSSLDVDQVSVVTEGSVRAITANADTPAGLTYNIRAQGIPAPDGLGYASGSISAFVRAHIQEGRGTGTDKAADLQYQEVTTANGMISLFEKIIAYQSGMRRI